MARKLGIGVVGAGSIGIRGALEHLCLSDVQDRTYLAAVCDPEPGRAQAGADRYGVRQAYESFGELIADDKVDAVTICSPIGVHYEQGLAAIRTGKHVHFNKTMTTTAAEACASRSALVRYRAFHLCVASPRPVKHLVFGASEPERRGPSFRPRQDDLRHALVVRVGGEQLQAVLHGGRRDPQVVRRDRRACLAKVRPGRRATDGRGLDAADAPARFPGCSSEGPIACRQRGKSGLNVIPGSTWRYRAPIHGPGMAAIATIRSRREHGRRKRRRVPTHAGPPRAVTRTWVVADGITPTGSVGAA
jgi:hypothetical protein